MTDQAQYELSSLKLWSPLQRQLVSCGLTKASPQQWIGTIRNLQKKGVSAVEIEWSDVISWLGGVPESERTFHELAAFAAALDGKPPPEPAKQLLPVVHLDELLDFLSVEPPCELTLQRHVSNEYVPQVRYEKQPRPSTFPSAVVVNGLREVKVLHLRIPRKLEMNSTAKWKRVPRQSGNAFHGKLDIFGAKRRGFLSFYAEMLCAVKPAYFFRIDSPLSLNV